MVFVHVVAHVVQKHVHAPVVGTVGEGGHGLARPKPPIHLGATHGPVAVVPTELARHLGAEAVLPQPPRSFGVGRDGGNPHRVHPELVEVAFFKLGGDPLEIATEVVGQRQDAGIVHWLVVVDLAIEKPVHHEKVHGGAVPIGAVQVRDVGHRRIACCGNQKVLSDSALVGRPGPHMVPSAVESREHDRQGDGLVVASVVDQDVVDGDEQVCRSIHLKKELSLVGKRTQAGRLWGLEPDH